MSCDLAIIRAVNYSIMKLDEMRLEAIKQNITIGELYIRMEQEKMEKEKLNKINENENNGN
jgi:hypothetical protein